MPLSIIISSRFFLTLSVSVQARWVGRQWRYSIKWSEAGARVSKNIVVVSSKARQSVDVVRTRVWTGTRELAGPVPVYTRLSVGSSPVLGARVYLDVEVENSNGTVFVLLPSLMLDNGHGEPDITGDDGESFNPIPPGAATIVTTLLFF